MPIASLCIKVHDTQMKVLRTAEFAVWLSALDSSVRSRVLARLTRVEIEGHFGVTRDLGERVSEMKWRQTLRVYFTLIRNEDDEICICLLGGDKDGQRKDIEKAKKFAKEIHR